MTEEKFQEQMLRLTEVFGAKHYTTPRLKLILGGVKNIPDGVFERAVTRLIMTKRVAPLVIELQTACDQVTAEDKQRAKENAPSVGMFDQLRDAAHKTTADREFAALCLKTLQSFLDRRITPRQFWEACDGLDSMANQINPRGKINFVWKRPPNFV